MNEEFKREQLSNHKNFYKTILRIREGDFVLSSADYMGHINSLQDKIICYILKEQGLRKAGWEQRVTDAKEADLWLHNAFMSFIK